MWSMAWIVKNSSLAGIPRHLLAASVRIVVSVSQRLAVEAAGERRALAPRLDPLLDLVQDPGPPQILPLQVEVVRETLLAQRDIGLEPARRERPGHAPLMA